LPQNALTVTAAAVVGQRQDEEMRTLTEASLAQNERRTRRSTDLRVGGHPVRATLIGTIYGMNFDTRPALHGRWVPDGGVPHDRHGRGALPGVQTPPLALICPPQENRHMVSLSGSR
jgi:hypothetical protein